MYLSEVFYWLLSMSITASLCTFVILLVRLIPKIPKNIIRHLWLIPFLRLILPFGLPLKYGFMELTAKLTRTVAVPVSTDKANSLYLTYNHIALAEKYVPFTYKTDMIRKIFDTASVVWLTVAIITVAFIAISYVITIREYKNARQHTQNIYHSEKAEYPFLLGIIRPKIVLPCSLFGEDTSHIISHEAQHIKALDNLSRLLAVTVCAFHWFNPLVWIFLRIYITDLERACDERVIKNYNPAQRKEYAMTLTNIKKPTSPMVCGMGASKLSKRIRAIVSYKKLSVISLVFVILLFAATAYILLSNGKAPTP